MPTGYTSDVKDGISFNKFVLICARAFGALVTMRDEPSDAEIPEKFKGSTYNTKALREAEKDLGVLEKLTDADKKKGTQKAYDEEFGRVMDSMEESRELAFKYQDMIANVKAWTPPTKDHTELKSFMLEQLKESLRFDCNTYTEKDLPKLQTAEQWFKKRRSELLHDITYHREEARKETERTDGRNAWVKALRDSLK